MSVLSEAFGWTRSETTTPSPKSGSSTHEIFIHSQLLPLVTKLQKEVRGRRTKELYTSLQEAVKALKSFQNEEWPPKHDRNRPTATAAQKRADQEEETVDLASADTQSTGDATAATEATADDEQQSQSATAATSTEDTLRVVTEDEDDGQRHSQANDDDPQTREQVHPAIKKTIECLIEVMGHPAKTNKACEWALDTVTLLVANHYVSGRAGGQDDFSGSGSNVDAEKDRPPPSLVHQLMDGMSKCAESNVELIQIALIKATRTIMTSPNCGIHEATMLMALRSTFHVYLVSKSQTCRDSAKSALLDVLRSVFSRMEAYDAVARSQAMFKPSASEQDKTKLNGSGDSSTPDTKPPPKNLSSFVSQYHTDSYVLFRALCKLSSKELQNEGEDEPDRARLFNTQIPPDPLALNSKILSLELILAAMDYCGEAFCEGEKFIYLVQHYLCVSLLKNCMSNHTQVAFLSQKIFLVLVYKFKGHLKQEIEVFLSNIFLRVLESQNSSFKQKAMVLESLRSLCSDPILLTQIFLNYDCDYDAKNLYKDIVHILTKLGGKATSAPSANVSKKDAEEDFELSLAGIEVLVTILKAFLRALGLPGGEEGSDDTAGARIRGMLQLDVGLAARPKDYMKDTSHSSAGSMTSDEVKSSDLKAVDGDGASSSDVAGKIVDAFEMKRNAEQNFEIGAVKFTLSLKAGLLFFIENGFVKCDAREIALFFLSNKDRLDKTQMGEVLGKEPDSAFIKGDGVEAEKGGPGFYVRILHHYVDALEFTGLVFDEAIRLFLSGFRLPGEAQKIDRIMEKFAEKFTSQNPEVFPSSDTAFILAFSVIMLNTDLHNPSIKPERRMTVESFMRNNSGIGEDGGDLPNELLEGIFNRIKERPFSLKEDDAARERAGAQNQIFDTTVFFEGSSLFGTSAEERKREKFNKEREEMVAATEQLIRRRPDKNAKATATASTRLTDNVAPADVVKPMFDVTWGPMLGILSQVLECSDDERSVAVCLNGFVYAVRIASHSSMSLARDTFISSLAKFTFLGSLKEMKRKNIESIRTLLSIAVIDGEYLRESWGPVLQCISQLARLRLTASGLDSDESFLTEEERPKKAAQSTRVDLFRQPSKGEIAREAEEINGRAVLEAVQEVLIDKVFSSSVNLSANSLAHFIEQLIAVSSSEIEGKSKGGITGVQSSHSTDTKKDIGSSRKGADGPSIFSLQRLVEVADYNMDVRPRLVWAQVWEMMADFFAKIACHENAMVSVFAIDSLRQLSFKFLEKQELCDYNFQRIFLRPFLVVMEDKGSREDIRELVLRCVDNMIRTKSHNLRSGWKIVFSILTRSANDPSEKIDYLGLAILQRLLDEHLTELCVADEASSTEDEELTSLERKNRNTHVDDFVGLCRASLSFIQKKESDSPRPLGLSMRAFCHTAIYADLLGEKRVLPPVSGAQSTDPLSSGYTYEGLPEKEALEMVLWRPLLEGLAEGIRSTAKSSAGGVGCVVQRGSVLALRAILFRHGHLFSTDQWVAVLEQTIVPSIQAGAESDRSTIIDITSESPSVSNVDFLVDSLPLPPPADDVSLLRFEASLAPTPKRSLGKAELMLEASFTDLRHGGDGDLRRAYILAKKTGTTAPRVNEQPFPDSWLATTAPIALGLLTDVASEVALNRGTEGREKLMPIIICQYRLWCLGQEPALNQDTKTLSEQINLWTPCEALVRISCREFHRFSLRLAEKVDALSKKDAIDWVSLALTLYSDLLSQSVEIEDAARHDLLQLKNKAYVDRIRSDSEDEDTLGGEDDEDVTVYTPYGRGRILMKRKDSYPDVGDETGTKVVMNVIALDFGATLYSPATDTARRLTDMEESDLNLTETPSEAGPTSEKGENGIPVEVNVPNAYWTLLVPLLKIRCVAAHCLLQSLVEVLDPFIPLVSKDVVSGLLRTLNCSLLSAEAAARDEDVSTAFQEALLSDWGDGVAAVEEALDSAARLSHLHGSAMFFLTQEAGTTRAIIQMLSILYSGREGACDGWDREEFAEPHLLAIMKDVMDKFLTSEERDGHLIDPNVWRNASESGGKVALYCTSFATVVVDILKIILSVRPEQFASHKEDFFPTLCTLIRVQSEEIRQLVQEIFAQQVAPLLGVEIE